MSTATLTQVPPPRTPLRLVAPPAAPEPCTTPWCVEHDDFGDVCVGRQTRISDGDHAVVLTKSPEDTDDRVVYASLGGNESVPMTPAEALQYASVLVLAAQTAMDAKAGAR